MSVSENRTELYVGLFVFIGLAVMSVLILQFGRFGDRLKDSYPLHVNFEDATGIFDGVDVRLGGVKIGSVSGRARPDPSLRGVVVDLVIFSDYQIPRNGEIRIRTSGLMGDSYVGVEIPHPSAKEFFQPDETVDGVSGGDLEDLTNTAEELSSKAKTLLDEVTVTVKEVRKSVDTLNSALGKFDNDVLGDENIENVKVAIANLRETSEKISDASEKFGPVIDETRSAVRNANGAFESAQEIVIQLEPVIDDFEKAAKGASVTVDKFNHGDGLLTALLNDAELRAEFTALIANLRNHGVLRYKDSAGSGSSPAPRASTPQEQPAEAPEKKSWRPFNRKR